MKILYHHRTQAADAQGIHIYEIIKAFREAGHEVREVALASSGRGGQNANKGGFWRVPTALLGGAGYELLSLLYNAVGYVRLARAVREFRPDFIYERYALFNAAGVLAARRFRIPLLLEVNAPLAMEQDMLGKLTFRRLAYAVERWICRRASRTLCVSTPLKEILVSAGVPGEHIEVIPNGVDPGEFNGGDGEAVRRRYGLGGKRVLGFVGWVREWHGIAELISGMSSWDSTLDDVHLLIIGDGPARAAIEATARRLGLSQRVQVTGPVARDDIVHHIAALDVAIQPAATAYASPMKLFEYLAMGRPIVAPRQANITELLTDGENCRLFKAGDVQDLARVVGELMNAPAARAELGRRARQTIFQRQYLWSENARRAAEIAEHLQKGHCRAVADSNP